VARFAGQAETLRAAHAVADALGRLPANRALTLAELAGRTGVSVDRLRRLVVAMVEAGWRIESEPDSRGAGPPECRARVYSLALPTPGVRREGWIDGSGAAP
jgi:hypothetical protein